jgi:hypothetical protein
VGARAESSFGESSAGIVFVVTAVDVLTEIVIERPRRDVAAYVSDPDNATEWYVNIEAVQWQSPKPVVPGSRMEFIAHFLGRTLRYTYEVTDLIPDERFVMRTAEGPFPMETTYAWRRPRIRGKLPRALGSSQELCTVTTQCGVSTELPDMCGMSVVNVHRAKSNPGSFHASSTRLNHPCRRSTPSA